MAQQRLCVLFDCHHGTDHLEAALAQQASPLALLIGVGIFGGVDHAGDPRSQDGVGTRRGLALAGAGFERHEERGARGLVAGCAQGLHLGVISAVGLMPSLTHDAALALDDSADRGIGLDVAEALARQGEGICRAGLALLR